MRPTFRLILSLTIGVVVVALVSSIYQVRAEKRGLRHELEHRAEVLSGILEESVEPVLRNGSERDLKRIVKRVNNDQQLAGIAVYDVHGNPLAVSAELVKLLPGAPPLAKEAIAHDRRLSKFFSLYGVPMLIFVTPLHQGTEVIGAVAIFHNTLFVDTQSSRLWRATFVRILIEIGIIVLITLLIVRWSIEGPIYRIAEWMKAQRAGRTVPHPDVPGGLFQPLTHEVTSLATSLAEARTTAALESRLRDGGEWTWNPERLRIHVKTRLKECPLFVISNREPYAHVRRNGAIEVQVPASGLVTAMEPVLLSCQGTWIASGSGNADRATVDADDRLRVPPEDPQYTLRRVWLTEEEEQGYYFGFANEGLWPLCHIAHARPLFRGNDWKAYQEVNAKFAQAVIEEMNGTENPVVLIQDYHFALLPRMVKSARPDARVSIFWHIPWPNPQAFGICPWQRPLLDGLLGADLVGFHIQAHCNYFLETVDAVLESRINWEHFSVSRRGHRTLVRPFPISVAFDENPGQHSASFRSRAEILEQLGVRADFVAVGVERVDYTKGILERFLGVERFLEKYPQYRGRFVLLQIGAPSRTEIKRYADLLKEVETEAGRINARFGDPAGQETWRPIVLLRRHHSHHEIGEYYRAADLCIVTSLHDGMNLVAKEFVAARDDEDGVLILSRFTGASRELTDAVIVNPYDTDQIAEAIRAGIEMDPEDRRTRMEHMRRNVSEHNIYRWAGNLIGALADIRIDKQSRPLSSTLQSAASGR